MPEILNRWSPRAMTGEELTDDELMPLFDAARWAPSSYNAQLWRFLYAKRDTEHWEKFLDLLVEGNQGWAKDAAVLVVVISRSNFEKDNKPAKTHVFDAGAAWENLAIEGSTRGLVVHGMEGFDYAKAKEVLDIPDEYEVLAMIAIGKKKDSEEKANTRRPLQEIIMEGKFRR